MENHKEGAPEDEREISLNETSLKRPPDVIGVIGGHGPWQFRLWIVFFLASLCNSMVAFAVLFLPLQSFCSPELRTEEAFSTLNNSKTGHTSRSTNASPSENVGCNSTSCNTSGLVSFSADQCWSSKVEALAKCCYFLACLLSGIIVYLSNDRFGWRPTALSSSLFLVASSLGTGWASTPAAFLTLRFVVSLCIINTYLISAFSLIKYVHEDFKLLYLLTGHMGWGVAHFLLPAVAWLAEDWKSFNTIFSAIFLILSFFVWLSPESPSSFPKNGEFSRTRKVLKYAAFSNGYSTTDVDLLSHNNYCLMQENKHEFGTLASPKAKALFVAYSTHLFLLSFTTSFLYFSSKWHSEWFKVLPGKIGFSFLGTTEVAATLILLFLTCIVSIKYLWAVTSSTLSVLLIVVFSRTKEGSSKSSTLIYVIATFFASAAFTLVFAKSFCHRISGGLARHNLVVTGVGLVAGSLAASAVLLKVDHQDVLLIAGVPHLLLGVTTVFLPDNYFGRVS